MTKDTRKNFKIDAETLDKIQYIASVTGWSQQQVLRVLIEPYFEVASTYKKCTFENWSSIKDRSVFGQFYGAKKDETLVLEEIPERLSLGERTNELLNDKIEELGTNELANNSAKKKVEEK